MNKHSFNTNWNGFAVSVIGSSHINKEIPCQDVSLVIDSPRPAVIVCDGRGSASLSHFGAQAAVKAFQTQLAVFEPMLKTILDAENVAPERWDMFSRIIYRTLAQSKQDLLKEYNDQKITEQEFDFTVACAITGKHYIGCFQVGDGAIVLRKNGEVFTVFEPDKGEFANQTVFLRKNGEMQGKFKASFVDANGVDGIAITSDGPECLMFKLPEMIPSGVFGSFFDEMITGNFRRQDLVDYLTRPKWTESYYGSDDRSVALLVLAPVEESLVSAEFEHAETENTEPGIDAKNPTTADSETDNEHSSIGNIMEDLCEGTIVLPKKQLVKPADRTAKVWVGILAFTTLLGVILLCFQDSELKQCQLRLAQTQQSLRVLQEKVNDLSSQNDMLRSEKINLKIVAETAVKNINQLRKYIEKIIQYTAILRRRTCKSGTFTPKTMSI